MHACVLDLGKFGDGTGQFALQGALVVDALYEVGLPDLGFVKELEADALPMQGAFAGEFEPGFIDHVCGHLDGSSRIGDPVRDFFLLQVTHDAGRIFLVQLAVKGPVVDHVHPEDHAEERDEEREEQASEEDALSQ